MTFTQAIILGAIQGVTEFLPISSSAHLILVPWLMNWPDQGLTFDVVVHEATNKRINIDIKNLFNIYETPLNKHNYKIF